MIRYKGALYQNIYLKNGFLRKKTAYGDGIAIVDAEELQNAIFRAVYLNENFKTNKQNIFELTDKGWRIENGPDKT